MDTLAPTPHANNGYSHPDGQMMGNMLFRMQKSMDKRKPLDFSLDDSDGEESKGKLWGKGRKEGVNYYEFSATSVSNNAAMSKAEKRRGSKWNNTRQERRPSVEDGGYKVEGQVVGGKGSVGSHRRSQSLTALLSHKPLLAVTSEEPLHPPVKLPLTTTEESDLVDVLHPGPPGSEWSLCKTSPSIADLEDDDKIDWNSPENRLASIQDEVPRPVEQITGAGVDSPALVKWRMLKEKRSQSRMDLQQSQSRMDMKRAQHRRRGSDPLGGRLAVRRGSNTSSVTAVDQKPPGIERAVTRGGFVRRRPSDMALKRGPAEGRGMAMRWEGRKEELGRRTSELVVNDLRVHAAGRRDTTATAFSNSGTMVAEHRDSDDEETTVLSHGSDGKDAATQVDPTEELPRPGHPPLSNPGTEKTTPPETLIIIGAESRLPDSKPPLPTKTTSKTATLAEEDVSCDAQAVARKTSRGRGWMRSRSHTPPTVREKEPDPRHVRKDSDMLVRQLTGGSLMVLGTASPPVSPENRGVSVAVPPKRSPRTANKSPESVIRRIFKRYKPSRRSDSALLPNAMITAHSMKKQDLSDPVPTE